MKPIPRVFQIGDEFTVLRNDWNAHFAYNPELKAGDKIVAADYAYARQLASPCVLFKSNRSYYLGNRFVAEINLLPLHDLEWIQPPETTTMECTCPSRVLFLSGCQCGYAEQVRQLKKAKHERQ